jgi:hypothetical protein
MIGNLGIITPNGVIIIIPLGVLKITPFSLTPLGIILGTN